jgi:hypothetical protein
MSKRPSPSKDAPVRKEPKAVALHASQKALVKRATKALLEGQGVILASQTGTGKTSIANAVCKHVAKGEDRALVVLVTCDAAQAKKLGPAFGSQYLNGFHFGNAGGVRKALASDGAVHLTMTARYFKEHLLGLEGRVLAVFEQSFVGPIAPTKVVFALDEVEAFCKDGWHGRLKRMRTTSSVPVTFLGLSATPGANDTRAYHDIFGQIPECLVFTEAEQVQWDADMRLQPLPPATWTQVTIPGAPTVRYTHALAHMQALILGDKIATTFGNGGLAPPIDSWKAKQDIIGRIVADMAAGGGDGGVVFGTLDERSMRAVGEERVRPCTEALVVAHWAEAGAARHMELLEELRDDRGAVLEGVPEHTVHDLTSRMLAKSKMNLGAFHASFKDQASGTALGFIHTSNAKSTNDLGKNVTGIVAVGAWPPDKLTQLKDRLSRIVPLEEGDIVPVRFTLTHVRSAWGDALSRPPLPISQCARSPAWGRARRQPKRVPSSRRAGRCRRGTPQRETMRGTGGARRALRQRGADDHNGPDSNSHRSSRWCKRGFLGFTCSIWELRFGREAFDIRLS